jgi:hypothetical protein
MVDKIALETDVEALRAELKKKERLLERVKNANTQYAAEPPVGTVIRFSRSIGGTRNYTFVAVRNEPGWSVTGRRNSLNYLGLVEGSTNTWEALAIAIGQSVIEEAVGWDVVKTRRPTPTSRASTPARSTAPSAASWSSRRTTRWCRNGTRWRLRCRT